MNITQDQKEILGKAILTYGHEAQTDMVIEECSELIQAIQKHKRNENAQTLANLIDECSDVIIMAEQLIFMIGEPLVKHQVDFKIRRLKEKLENN